MWPIQLLRDLKLPREWGLYQAIHVIDATTFEMYRTNMQSMIVDQVSEADMVLFNRCTPDMPLSGWKRSIRAVNRMCEIVFEDERGEELEVEDILPYSLDSDHLELEDDDYGIWYIDIQDHPERYEGKTVTFKAQAMTSMKLPKGTFIPGRNAMTCCVDDIRFFGFLCKYDRSRSLRKGEWVMVTAQIRWEHAAVYEGEGVVLYAQSVEKAEAPKIPWFISVDFHPPVEHSALPGDFSCLYHMSRLTPLLVKFYNKSRNLSYILSVRSTSGWAFLPFCFGPCGLALQSAFYGKEFKAYERSDLLDRSRKKATDGHRL